MFGRNILIKPQYTQRATLNVVSVFRTIQGEGPFAGEPAIFIRLAGCNLACHFCDTDFESGAKEKTVSSLIEEVRFLAGEPIALVVLTGGEPLAQPVFDLCDRLTREHEFHVQVETAGTVWQTGLDVLCERDDLTIVCSPKTGTAHKMIERYCDHWKYIVRAAEVDPDDGLPAYSTQQEGKPLRLYRPPEADTHSGKNTIWVSPCDEYEQGLPGAFREAFSFDRNHDLPAVKRNVDACVGLALKYGYRISFQLHKVLGVD